MSNVFLFITSMINIFRMVFLVQFFIWSCDKWRCFPLQCKTDSKNLFKFSHLLTWTVWFFSLLNTRNGKDRFFFARTIEISWLVRLCWTLHLNIFAGWFFLWPNRKKFAVLFFLFIRWKRTKLQFMQHSTCTRRVFVCGMSPVQCAMCSV